MRDFFSRISTENQVLVSLTGQPLACMLRVGRARLDFSQEEVARLAKVSRYRLHQAERGLISLRPAEIEKLAAILEMPGLRELSTP